MLKPEEWMDIGLLHREGHSIKQIARMTGRSRNTDSAVGGQVFWLLRLGPKLGWCNLCKLLIREKGMTH
jgi:hypothetical protein